MSEGENDRDLEEAVEHDAGYYRRSDGTCSYCDGRHPVEAEAA